MTGRRLLGLGLFLTVTIAAFEVTAIITALPTIVDELDGTSLYGAALAANMLSSIVAIVAAGEYADRHGPVRPFVASAVVYVVGLSVAGAAGSMIVVVLGRVLQGLGAGGFATLPYVAIRRAFPDAEQPKMYAVLSAAWVLPSLVAPLIAGAITDRFGWRWVFLAMIPLTVAVSTIVIDRLRRLPALPNDDAHDADHRGSAVSRTPQALQLACGAGIVLLGAAQSRIIVAAGLVGVGITVAALPLRRLLPTGWMHARPGLPAAVAARMCATAAFSGVDGFVPLAADRIHEVGPTAQGSVIIGAALAWTAGQAYAARVAGSARPARLVRAGFLLMALGAVLVAPVVWRATPLWTTFLAWSVGGLGMGLLFNPTTVVALSSVNESRAGITSSQLSMADSLGFATTSAVGGALIAASERGSFSLQTALLCSFAMTVAIALFGSVVGRSVRLVPSPR